MGKPSPNVVLICELIEADVDRLLDPTFAQSLTPALQFYRQVLLSYHRGDLAHLKKASTQIVPLLTQENSLLPLLTELRLVLLERNAKREQLAKIEKELDLNNPWCGEILILLAAIYETLGDFNSALRLHQKSAVELKKIGAEGKALRAESNSVANLSNLDPERKLIPEYTNILRQAKKLRQYNIMATTLLNLSREYQKMGALKNALRFCNRSVAACKTNPGGLTYYLALAHRAHLLLEMGRRLEAEVDFELACTSDFPVVKAACNVLSVLFGEASADPSTSGLNTWEERLSQHQKNEKHVPLSPVEEKLVRFLAEKPREKFAITDHLFGVELHPLTAENRLKNLIHRVRKKIPGLILLKDDLYSIADPELEVRQIKKTGKK